MTALPAAAPATSRYLLDRSLATLREAAPRWSSRGIEARIEDLSRIRALTFEVAPDLIADSLRAKGIGAELAGEEWVAGPLAVLRTARFLQHTLEGIRRRGEVPLADGAIGERSDGQVTVDVMPGDRWDKIMYRGWRATVRMDPGIGLAAARRHLGGVYTKPDSARAAVSLVLGAGNVSSITPLDLIQKLFVEGHVALLKFNPVNAYIGPYIEHAFRHLIDEGFVRTAYGDGGTGSYLVTHPEVDEIHITGSEHTHDAIVYGEGPDAARRKAEGRPLVTKRITSELGNVSPVIVAPGRWSRRQLEYQAGHVATQLVQNAGYNCNAAKAIVLPAGWDQRGEFMALIGARLASVPDRPAYYPGSFERYRRVVDAGGRVETFGESEEGLPPTIVGVDHTADHPAFSDEAFCRIMAAVEIPGDGPDEFLAAATRFCNERLRGTLNATVLVDPATLESHRKSVDAAVDDLRYGTVGLNLWGAAGFPLGVTPWGAFPGHTVDDIGSGIGFVHNARLIDRPQKTVVAAPFVITPMPAWSVFHRNAATALRRAAAFEAKPGLRRLAPLLAAAVRS